MHGLTTILWEGPSIICTSTTASTRRTAVLAFTAACVLVSHASTRGQTLLTTANGHMELDLDSSTKSLRLDMDLVEIQNFLSIRVEPEVVGIPHQFNFVGPVFNHVNGKWLNGERSPGIQFQPNGSSANAIGAGDKFLFEGGEFMVNPRLKMSVDSEVTPVSFDLHGLKLHANRIDVTLTNFMQEMLIERGSGLPLYRTEIDFTAEIFGDVGAIPEPSGLALLLVALILGSKYCRQLPRSLKDCS